MIVNGSCAPDFNLIPHLQVPFQGRPIDKHAAGVVLYGEQSPPGVEQGYHAVDLDLTAARDITFGQALDGRDRSNWTPNVI